MQGMGGAESAPPELSPVDLVEKGWVSGFGGVLSRMRSDAKPPPQHAKKE